MLIYNKNKAVQSFQTGGSTKRNRDWADWADDGIRSFFSPSTVGRKPADTWALRTPNTSVAPSRVAVASPSRVPINQADWGNPSQPVDPWFTTPSATAATQPATTIPYVPGYAAPERQSRPSNGTVAGRTGGAGATTSAKKTLPGSTRASANKESRIDRIKMIQRRLGVKDDGLWGAKTQAAFEAMKETQRSLGFTGKDVDGIYGKKTQAALDKRVLDKAASDKRDAVAMSDMEDVEAAIKSGALKGKEDVAVAVTTDTKSKRDIRKDDIAYRRALRAAEKERGFASRRVGGIFYCSGS